MPKNQKTSRYFPTSDNPLEAIRDLGGSIGKQGIQAGKDIARGILESPFGNTKFQGGSYDPETESFAPSEGRGEEERKFRTERLRYIQKKQEFTLYSKEQASTQRKINELLFEIKKLAQDTSILTVETQSLVVEQRVVNPGAYHLNFLTFVISLIKEARQKINESRFWLMAIKSKKEKRQYWAMFKKHGTQFALSGERVVATQAG